MMARPALIVAAFLVLHGCGGYHLRGSTGGTWSLGRVYIDHGGSSALSYAVQRLLGLGEVAFVSTPATADTIVKFVSQNEESRVLSVDPKTGKVREFELIVEAVLRVTRADGTVLIDDDALVLQRDYVFDETLALAEYAEETTLLEEMREDMAAAVLRRLLALNSGTSAAAAPVRAP